jgi:hypothetical protein
MSKVFSANAVWVDGYTSGRTPDGGEEFGRGLGGSPMLVDSYIDGIMHLRLSEAIPGPGVTHLHHDVVR